MEGGSEKVTCPICEKEFSRVSAKNRHLRDMHNEEPLPSKRNRLIKCPICPEENKVGYEKHDMLINHLQQIHSLDIKTSFLTFKNEKEFETWRSLDNRNVDYIKHAHRKSSEGLMVYYECNRSNYSGFTSKCTQRSINTGGSIKMSGYCASRFRVKITNKAVDVKFVETHVGHDDLLRSKRLTKDAQKMIATKLIEGVSKERILEDSRRITNAPIDSTKAYGVVKEQAHLKLALLEESVGRKIAKIIDDAYDLQCSNTPTRKRKIDKQSYFPKKM